jgi:hypothetical protein
MTITPYMRLVLLRDRNGLHKAFAPFIRMLSVSAWYFSRRHFWVLPNLNCLWHHRGAFLVRDHIALEVHIMHNIRRPAYTAKRPTQRVVSNASPSALDIIWSPPLTPRETYRILYSKADGSVSERIIDLLKLGSHDGHTYLGVRDKGIFKSFRRDRVLDVLEQISTGHTPSLRAIPSYTHYLPPFPRPEPELRSGAVDQTLQNNQRDEDVQLLVFRVPQTRGNRTWSVSLADYTCTCPDKRIRTALGYTAGQLGMVCPHLARAILAHLPSPRPEAWTPDLLDWLQNPRNTDIDNLT